MALKTRKVVEGCLSAEDRKAWSGRKKETRFSGEPVGLLDGHQGVESVRRCM